ncbi:MAG: zinc ribbon domain-containing protein [Ruminiclostridium sp.]|nr:zinc ribbon domain-containing protein [Ruminiclostridium sp.]
MFCKNCGTQLPDTAIMCSHCGADLSVKQPQQQYQQPQQQYQQPQQQYQQPQQQYQQPYQQQYQQPAQPYGNPVQQQYQPPGQAPYQNPYQQPMYAHPYQQPPQNTIVRDVVEAKIRSFGNYRIYNGGKKVLTAKEHSLFFIIMAAMVLGVAVNILGLIFEQNAGNQLGVRVDVITPFNVGGLILGLLIRLALLGLNSRGWTIALAVGSFAGAGLCISEMYELDKVAAMFSSYGLTTGDVGTAKIMFILCTVINTAAAVLLLIYQRYLSKSVQRPRIMEINNAMMTGQYNMQ